MCVLGFIFVVYAWVHICGQTKIDISPAADLTETTDFTSWIKFLIHSQTYVLVCEKQIGTKLLTHWKIESDFVI